MLNVSICCGDQTPSWLPSSPKGEIVGNMMQSVVLDGNLLDNIDGNLFDDDVNLMWRLLACVVFDDDVSTDQPKSTEERNFRKDQSNDE